jgi:monooxygenase
VNTTHFDVLIVGAGLSGIGAACHLEMRCPGKTYTILEGRPSSGGTWDLFRYPGIRSDSDMYTLGYSFRPWTNPKAIADGPSILSYVRETAEAYGVDRKIRYQHRVEGARWSSRDARWTVQARDLASGQTVELTCGFLYVCAGYYDYDEGYTPEFAGRERFRGRIIHPQKWPTDLDLDGKRVVVIGSGATAVTLVPELAKQAAHVTMLQRSPTYMISAPEGDRIANWLRARLPSKAAYGLTRLKNVTLGMAFFAYCRRFPEHARSLIVKGARLQLKDKVPVEPHFTPSYKPWDQRLCLVRDGDLFAALRKGRASVVTDHIETFTEKGLRLRSGAELEADVIVTATGLKLKFLGGLALEVDGRRVESSQVMIYRGMMCSDVPNMAFAIGYTNASWTLKCDLVAEYVCRLLNYMDRKGYTSCLPHNDDPAVQAVPLMDFSSGYVQRSIDQFPRQGTHLPWKLWQNYALDRVTLKRARIDDGVLRFASAQ